LQNTLEYFLLSLYTLQLNEQTEAEKSCKEQIAQFIEELKLSLNCKQNILNLKAVHALDSELKHYLTANPNNPPDIEALILNLFPQRTPFNKQSAALQVRSLYNLIAQIEAFPLNKIKNLNALVSCEQNQAKAIQHAKADIQSLISRLELSLQQPIYLFSGMAYYVQAPYGKVCELYKELNHFILHLNSIISDYDKRLLQANQIYPSADRLDYITLQQHTILQQLMKLTTELKLKESKAEKYMAKLDEEYQSARQRFSHELARELDAMQSVLHLQNPKDMNFKTNDLLIEHEKILSWLRNSTIKPGLNLLKCDKERSIAQLQTHVKAFKADLKVKWANSIALLLTENSHHLFLPETDFKEILSLLRSHVPYRMPILHTDNPYSHSRANLIKQTNHYLPQIIEEFALLQHCPTARLPKWLNKMHCINQVINELLNRLITAKRHADIIEVRMAGSPFRTSLSILNTLDKEFIRILRAHIDEAIGKSTDPSLFLGIKNNPALLLTGSFLDQKNTNALNQIDLRLVKLLKISAQFKALNKHYVNDGLELCSDKEYLNSLFKITLSNLQNDSMEDFSKTCSSKRATLYYWIRVNILKPLIDYHFKTKNYLDPYFAHLLNYLTLGNNISLTYSRTSSSRFFKPVHKTPLGSKTERLIIAMGKNALQDLEPMLQAHPAILAC